MSENVDFYDGPFDSDESYSLVVARHQGRIALGRKSRGYGKGRLVLPGGKNQYYWSGYGLALVPENQGASRELRQETGLNINPRNLMMAAMLCIVDEEEETRNVQVFVGDVEDASSLRASDELTDPRLYGIGTVPYTEMPADYSLWLPQVLAGCTVEAFLQTEGEDVIAADIYYQKMQPLGRLQHMVSGRLRAG